MLAVTSYPQGYIDECRARMEAQLAAYKAETSVLKLDIGDHIRLNEAQFRLLFSAFFAEIEHKFT